MKEYIYSPSNTLDTPFTYRYEGEDYTTDVSGDFEHASLYAGMHQFEANYILGCAKAGAKNLAKTNMLNASIGILCTDAPLEEGDPGDFDFVSFPYRISQNKQKHLFRVMDLYDPKKNYDQEDIYPTKAGRNTTFNDHLKLHIRNAKIQNIHEIYTEKIDIDEEVKDSQFHEHFHHTEQGLAHSLYDIESKKSIYEMIKEQKNIKSLAAIFLDVHTVRPMCACCNIGVIGLQNSCKHGFVAEFTQYMNKKNENEIVLEYPDDGLTMRARVSCTQHASRDSAGLHRRLDETLATSSTPVESKVTFHYSRPRQVVQAYVDTGTHDDIIKDEKLANQFWKEDIFISHKLADKTYDKLMHKKAPK